MAFTTCTMGNRIASVTATPAMLISAYQLCRSHAQGLLVDVFYVPRERAYTAHNSDYNTRELRAWILGFGPACSACWCPFCAMLHWSLPESTCSRWVTRTSLKLSPNIISLSLSSMLHGVPVNLLNVFRFLLSLSKF
ncbi:hypothetical protein I3843_03G111300 [Carya illinoinensis]|nr:hypothetical protein I3843_03G111300 [Carya illinoinensis]